MRTTKLTIIIFALIASANLFAQGVPGEGNQEEIVKYLPIHRFPQDVLHTYKFTDSTLVTKYLPDSTQAKHQRVLTHYITILRSQDVEDGFLTIEASIDSSTYYLKEGNAEIYWDSQDENSGGINMQDLKYATVPLGKFFNMTISPYGEVAKIYGEKIDWFMDYLNKYSDQLNDSVEKFIWYDGVSIQRLSSITELKKIRFPNEKMAIDSTWSTPFNHQVEFINFTDTATARITDFTNGYLTVEATFPSMEAIPGNYLIYGIKTMLLPIEESGGKGTYTITLTPRGAIEKSTAIFDIDLIIPVRKESFKLNIQTSQNWELINQRRL